MQSLGKSMIIIGIIVIVIGFMIMFSSKFGLGKLPGDIYYKKGNIAFYFPVATCMIISIILSVIMNLFFRK